MRSELGLLSLAEMCSQLVSRLLGRAANLPRTALETKESRKETRALRAARDMTP